MTTITYSGVPQEAKIRKVAAEKEQRHLLVDQKPFSPGSWGSRVFLNHVPNVMLCYKIPNEIPKESVSDVNTQGSY